MTKWESFWWSCITALAFWQGGPIAGFIIIGIGALIYVIRGQTFVDETPWLVLLAIFFGKLFEKKEKVPKKEIVPSREREDTIMFFLMTFMILVGVVTFFFGNR